MRRELREWCTILGTAAELLGLLHGARLLGTADSAVVGGLLLRQAVRLMLRVLSGLLLLLLLLMEAELGVDRVIGVLRLLLGHTMRSDDAAQAADTGRLIVYRVH